MHVGVRAELTGTSQPAKGKVEVMGKGKYCKLANTKLFFPPVKYSGCMAVISNSDKEPDVTQNKVNTTPGSI